MDPIVSFAALGDPVRWAIVSSLRVKACTISEVAEQFDITLPAISRHVAILESADIVSRVRHGRSRILSLRSGALDELASLLATPPRHTDSAWTRLDDLLATQGHTDTIDPTLLPSKGSIA